MSRTLYGVDRSVDSIKFVCGCVTSALGLGMSSADRYTCAVGVRV